MFMEIAVNCVTALIFMLGTLLIASVTCIINYRLINFVLNHFELYAEFVRFINRKRKGINY